jgi:hypothetical protein
MSPFERIFHIIAFLVLCWGDEGYPTRMFFATEPQRLPWVPFRSQKPIGVIQEFYSLLLAYFVLCAVRHESAMTLGLPPQRLSFINTLRLIQQMAPLSQILWGSHQSQLQDLIDQWQDYFQLPLRDNRINPRVVRRKRNKFRRKKRSDKSILVAPISEVLRLV